MIFFFYSCHRNDAKTVNVITTACFSKVTKVSVFHVENNALFIIIYIVWVAALHILTCLSSCQVLVAGLKFFLGKDEDEKNDSDSESEASTKHIK